MAEYLIRFSTDSFYNSSDVEEMKEAIADTLIEIDDEVDGDSVTFEKVEPKKANDKKASDKSVEIDHEEIARTWLAENELEDNISLALVIHRENSAS